MKNMLDEGAFYTFTLSDSREYMAKLSSVTDEIAFFEKPVVVFYNQERKVEMAPASLTGDLSNVIAVAINSIQMLVASRADAVEAYTDIVEGKDDGSV